MIKCQAFNLSHFGVYFYPCNLQFTFKFQVLEEIKQKDIVEEISAAVFSVQLVLITPNEKATSSHPSKHTQSSVSTVSSRLKRVETGSAKKVVKFTDEQSSTGNYTPTRREGAILQSPFPSVRPFTLS